MSFLLRLVPLWLPFPISFSFLSDLAAGLDQDGCGARSVPCVGISGGHLGGYLPMSLFLVVCTNVF